MFPPHPYDPLTLVISPIDAQRSDPFSSESTTIPCDSLSASAATKTTAPDWCYQSFKKQAWRFAKICEFIFIHGAVLTGTTFAYSATCAGFITYLENTEETDMEVFEITFWLSLFITMLAGMKDALKYASFFYQCLQANDTDFNSLLKEKYKTLWGVINKPNATIVSLLNAMSFGKTISHISTLQWDIGPMATRSIAFGAGSMAGILTYLQKTHNANHSKPFSHIKTLGLCTGLSIITITNYIFSVFTNLQRNKHRMHTADVDSVYTYIALFGLLAIFYYSRLEYEMEVAERRKRGYMYASKIQELENRIKECIQRSSKKTASILLRVATTINNIGMSVVSASLLYSMWSSWRNAAVAFNIVAEDDLTMYPNTAFDVEVLLLLGIGNLTVRFTRLYYVTGKNLTNDMADFYESEPLLLSQDNSTIQ